MRLFATIAFQIENHGEIQTYNSEADWKNSEEADWVQNSYFKKAQDWLKNESEKKATGGN